MYNKFDKKKLICYICLAVREAAEGEPSPNGAGAGTPGGLIASKETARRTLTIKHNLTASIGEVCRDYAKSSRPKENGEA